MSDLNTTIINSVKKMEGEISEIKQILLKLQEKFDSQFGPAMTQDDMSAMQRSVAEQTGRTNTFPFVSVIILISL